VTATINPITAGVTTMTSREIAELTGKNHKNIVRDITSMLFVLQENALIFERIYFDSMNREQKEYALDRELTETLLTGYSAVLRRKVIVRWHELEGKGTRPRELSRMDILTLAIESERRAIEAEGKLVIAAPKVAFVDQYVESTGLKGFRQVAKLLEVKENWFRNFLADRKIMYLLSKEWAPYASHLDAGRFEVKTGTSLIGGHAFTEAKFTPRGIEWVAGLIKAERVSIAKAQQRAEG
jgi:phage antirepressor YoqD-like protein